MPPKKRTRQEAGLEDEYRSFTDEQLRKTLIETGQNPGPIDASNRDMYIRLLVRKQADGSSLSPSISPEKPSAKRTSSQLTRTPLVATRKSTGATKLSVSPALTAISPALTAKPKVSAVSNIKGLIAATYTPFTDDGELNLRAIRSYADFLLKQGVTSIFVNGSTGESVSLTDEERKLIAEEWLKIAGQRMNIIIHVGSMSLRSTCNLASHAESHGAAAISLMPPCFFKPPSLDSLVLYIQKVGEAAPNTSLLYYHIPSMTGVTFSMEELLQVASTSLPTLRGMKFTDEDLMEFTRCIAFKGGKYPVWYGKDQQVLASLVMGGTAAVGSTYNYCGVLNNRLFQSFHEGDMTTALMEQRRSDEAIVILKKYGKIAGHVGAGKAILKAKGFDAGPPRLPLLPLSVDDHDSLVSDLKSIGFFEWS